jgi:hypothetical protein
MHSRLATHAEAVYVARALNLHIEAVWQIIQGLHFASYTDLELAVHSAFLERQAGMNRKRSA